MSSYLFAIQESVTKYAQVISDIIGMDVDIADRSLTRVAGTGAFASRVGRSISDEGHAFQCTMASREFIAIENPGQNEICRQCASCDSCQEKYEICCPILLSDEAIGAMAIATFDEKKVPYIRENLRSFRNFLENISEMIAAKVAEYKDGQSIKTTLELLRRMIDFISEGVIIFKDDRSILFLNHKAELLLGCELRQLAYLCKIREFSIRETEIHEKTGNTEYQFRVRGKQIRVRGNSYPIVVDEKESARVFVFEDVAALHQNFFQTGHENINFNTIIGRDKSFLRIKQQAVDYACSSMNLLIRGESGTGKEVFARAICNGSPRKNKPFVTVSCNGTLDAISEKELFGFFENSPDDKSISKFELAAGGTLFIDGIERLPLRLQSRLVRFMVENRYDVRVIVSAAADLETLVANGGFMPDLFYMLDVNTIRIPPVRRRKKDIRLLVDCFLAHYNSVEGKQVTFGRGIYAAFQEYRWPGNVREIDSMVSLIVTGALKSELETVEDLPVTIQEKIAAREDETFNLKELEKRAIVHVLNNSDRSTQGKVDAARTLGISVASLYRKIKEYGLVEKANYELSK